MSLPVVLSLEAIQEAEEARDCLEGQHTGLGQAFLTRVCGLLGLTMRGRRQKASMRGYHCRVCGEYHDELPMHYGAAAPALWFMIPEPEREKRCVLSSDQCIIDDKYFFIIGNLEIPVAGLAERFSWDVWVSLSAKNFARACEMWEKQGRESEPPYFGWLSTALPCYPDTLSLKTRVHTRAVGCRPWIELEPTDHPLAVEQREGITLARVQETAELVLHGQ